MSFQKAFMKEEFSVTSTSSLLPKDCSSMLSKNWFLVIKKSGKSLRIVVTMMSSK